MINKLQNIINKSQKIVFFSGAGISTDSGIPDFRSNTGLYKTNLSAEEMISHSYFVSHTNEFFEFYRKAMIFPDAKPNYGHQFIAELGKTKDVSVVTQNIDGLHQKAGSKKVYELHGSIHRNYCMNCHKFYSLEDILNMDVTPKCQCGGIIKPDVVLYEEGLDEEVIRGAVNAIASCDTLVILGTSLVVYPAASFVRYFRGDNLVIINKQATSKDEYCDVVIHDSISETFKQIKI
ncbi:MAG: NAD-dependent protein deacylase [Erysipelotrichaceae bacterium]|nr:NAD-dependent protein deacylase [Erysipelotrichaceae bacterium]